MGLLQKRLNKQLMDGVATGNMPQIEQALKKGASTEAHYANGDTPLVKACQMNNIKIVERLLEANANPNATNDRQNSCLNYAVQNGYMEIVEALLAAGADANFRTAHISPPLHQASKRGDAKCVKLLLSHGADINLPDHERESALFVAYRHHQEDAAKLLLDEGANPNQRSHGGFAPLTLNHCLPSLTEALLDAGARVSHSEYKVLGWAVEQGRYDIALKLLNAGSSPNVVTPSFGYPVLHCAASAGEATLVQAMIKAGVNIDVYSKDGQTALHTAVRAGDCDTVKALLDGGAGIDLGSGDNNRDPSGDTNVTALRIAAICDNADMVELLLDEGADPTIKSSQGFDALSAIAMNQNPSQAVREMLERAVAAWPSPWRQGAVEPVHDVVAIEAEAAKNALRDKYRINTDSAKARGL